MMKTIKSDILFLIGKSFIFYWFILLVVASIGFIFGSGLSTIYSYISLLILMGVLTYLYQDFKVTLQIIVGLLFLMIVSILLALQIWDFGWDGRAYHFTAVQALSEGWNPMYTHNLGSFPGYSNADRIDEINNVWIECYPKANWIFLANNLQIFENIDAAKYINYALLVSSAFILNNFLKKDIKNILLRLLFILPILFNPVSVGQINTLYLDGNLYFLFIIFSIALANYYSSKNADNFLFLTSITIILLNLKFTAVVFLIIGFTLFFTLQYIKTKKLNLKLIVKWFAIFFLGIVVFGFSPYITNTYNHGNPLYPVAGENKRDIIPGQMYNEFLKLNRFQMFFYSINSKPTNDKRHFPELLNPIKISLDMNNYKRNSHDIRINGFGPLYSITILLTLMGLLYALYRRYAIDKYFLISVMFIIMSFSIPTTWWARLVPMMWAVPIFFSLYFYQKTDKLLKILSFIIVLLLLINAYLVAMPRLEHNYRRTSSENQTISKLTNQYVNIAFPAKGIGRAGKRTTLHKLNINNIKYEIIKNSNCKKTTVFYDSNICSTK